MGRELHAGHVVVSICTRLLLCLWTGSLPIWDLPRLFTENLVVRVCIAAAPLNSCRRSVTRGFSWKVRRGFLRGRSCCGALEKGPGLGGGRSSYVLFMRKGFTIHRGEMVPKKSTQLGIDAGRDVFLCDLGSIWRARPEQFPQTPFSGLLYGQKLPCRRCRIHPPRMIYTRS